MLPWGSFSCWLLVRLHHVSCVSCVGLLGEYLLIFATSVGLAPFKIPGPESGFFCQKRKHNFPPVLGGAGSSLP